MKILHVRTRAEDPLADAVAAAHRASPGVEVCEVPLGGDAGPEVYEDLLERIFRAEMVHVW